MMSLISNSQPHTGMEAKATPSFSNTSVHPNGHRDVGEPSARRGADDTILLSKEGKARAVQDESGFVGSKAKDYSRDKSTAASPELSTEERAQLQELKRRDSEVRTHEQAHMAAAGQYSRGGPSFSLQKGPDGKSYAIGGEVNIDVGKEKTPEETVAKMRVIKQAALAPANPSSADRRIAAQASVKEAQARQEMSASLQDGLLQTERQSGDQSSSISDNPDPNGPPPAIGNAVGTLKTMLDAYKMAASY